MAAYSLGIVDAVERGDASKREIARLFGVHETFVHKLLRQKRERGDIAPLPRGGGAEAILKEDHLMILSELVAESTLRSLKARTKRKLNNALAKAIKMISVDDICGWFAHCGYVFSFI